MNRFCVFLLLCLLTVSETVLGSVLAIDYGVDWIKASLMKPGVPFDVLLNKDSKRKIQSSVGWKQSDRLFGSDAFNIAGRFPLDSFSSLKYLLAAPHDSEAVSFYTSISSADVVETSRGTVALRRSDGTEWSVEELVAMQFAYVRELAESLAGERVHDVIVTVPPYYTQFERDAVVDAVEIAGMRTLALVHDGTAVAVNYAMTRTFPDPEYHVIYDAGASAIRATVVNFASVASDPKAKSLTKDSTQISVAGVGFDRMMGGTELDRRLRNIMLDDFRRKHKKDLLGDKRAMAKLWKEAGRVKTILSANADATATIESLTDDIDYRAKLTRAEFEEACQDLKGRYAQPIFEALENAGLTLDNVTSVILTGGASRTPMIQSAVKAAVGDSKIALNVNADEAAVLGAALHGASLSRQFKTKDIKVSDIGVYDIQVSYLSEPKSPSAKQRTLSTLVYPTGSKTGSKKTLTFRRKEDFTVNLSYQKPPPGGFPTELLAVDIIGVSDAIRNLTELGAIEPVVKATVTLSDSGFVSIKDAVAVGEYKAESIADKLKGLFGAGSSSETETEAETETAARDEGSSSSSSTAEASSTADKKASVKDEPISLELQINFPSLAPMTVAEKRQARERLIAVDNEEAAKRRKEEARNTLEGYMYRVRDLLDDDSDTPFLKCSQDEERKAIREKLQETFAWLSEHGDDADTAQYLDKRASLEVLERPIIYRYEEIQEFPHALNNSQMWNWHTRLFLTDAKTNLTTELETGAPSKYTKEELDALEKTLIEHEKWLNEWVEKQKAVKMNEDPVLLTSELKARAKVLENQLQKLVRKKAPRSTTKKASTASSTGASETSTSTEPSSTTSAVPPTDESERSHDEL
ncbi:actin-like ATPase domain-containing protein [Obba rivulosa]|uniref:Actin-like ATPase domain-containing protein n=1 Tax=Obba rivulosa TaxID=1052685 RepID=A0A8E2DJX5_9APHY|nr:actin-like ATPase domain-containing protein [Obba rivulosa]